MMKTNIFLRRANSSDFDDFWIFCSNQKIAKYLTWSVYSDKNVCRKFFEEKLLKYHSLPNCYLMIDYEGVAIGNVHMIVRSDHSVQIGMGLLPEYWNQGIGTAVLKQIEDYLSQNFEGDYCEIIADFHYNNVAMQKILTKSLYVFYKDIENSRKSFRKIIETGVTSFDFISWLEESSIVECVISGGSLSEDELSDVDMVVVLYEEKDIQDFICRIRSISCLTHFEMASSNHMFVSFHNQKIFDLHFVSAAFVNMFYSIKNVVIDKSGMIPHVMNIPSKLSFEKCFSAYLENIKKMIYKLQNKKYIQATRILTDIRNGYILPLGEYFGVLVAQNAIHITWINNDNIFSDTYHLTFVPPYRNELQVVLKKLIELADFIVKESYTDSFEIPLKEIKEYAQKLF